MNAFIFIIFNLVFKFGINLISLYPICKIIHITLSCYFYTSNSTNVIKIKLIIKLVISKMLKLWNKVNNFYTYNA